MEIRIPASELLAATYFAVNGKDAQTRPLLSAVKVWCGDFSNDGTSYGIVATDSVKLVEFTGIAVGYSQPGEVLINAEQIRSNVRKTDLWVEIKSDDIGNITVTCINKKGAIRCRFDAKCVDGNYPRYEKLFNFSTSENVPTSMSFNATFMADICQAIAIAYGENVGVSISYNGNNKPALIESNNADQGKCRAIVMPIRRSYDD